MMKIGVIDTIFPIGHKSLNNKLLSFLADLDINLIVTNNENYFTIDRDNIKYKKIKVFSSKKRYSARILNQIYNYIKLKKDVRDCQILLHFTFDTLSFIFASFILRGSTNVVFHHNNVDLLSNKYFSILFYFFKNRIKHIVFAEFIKDRLIHLGVKEKNVFVLTHPIPQEQDKITYDSASTFLGIGYALDENWTRNIIQHENDYKILDKCQIQLILRTGYNHSASSGAISIISKHLTEREYENLIKNSKGILILYSDNYKYRYSGAILDALRNNKIIIGNNIPIIKYFKELYPEFIFEINDIDDLFKTMISVSKKKIITDNSHFLSNHSDLRIQKDLTYIISNLTK